MSKIERALRKAEEEKRLKEQAKTATPSLDEEAVNISDSGENLQEEGHEAEETSEYFRKIAARLKSYYDSVGPTDVVFTSAVSGEGKTTASVNCAISLCQDFNLSVCLVDCDLRNPQISAYFEPNGSAGIIEALKQEAELDHVVRPTSISGLSVVQAHKAERKTLPLLNSERFRRLVRDLKDRFDFVIFDSSPVLPVTDTVIISRYVSAIVLIVESEKTRRKHLEQILEQIDDKKIIGFIMNHKKHRIPDAYSYAKYYQYGPKGGASPKDKRFLRKQKST
jgi:capsular exopolysaccharide synthesis family protein